MTMPNEPQILEVTVKTRGMAQGYVLDIINDQEGYTVTRMSMGIDGKVGYCLEREGKVVARVAIDPQNGIVY